MAKRFRSTNKFDKAWFMELPPDMKCAVDYIHDKCDAAGVWDVNLTLLNTSVNARQKITEERILQIDNGNQFLKLPNGKIYAIGFIQFQYSGIPTGTSPAHKPILISIEKNNLSEIIQKEVSNTLFNTLSNRVQEKDKYKDKDKDIETDKEKEKEKEGESENNIEVRKSKFFTEVSLFRNQYPDELLKEFFEYWSEHNPNAEKFRKEFEKVFDIDRRLKTWNKNKDKFSKHGNGKQTSTNTVADIIAASQKVAAIRGD